MKTDVKKQPPGAPLAAAPLLDELRNEIMGETYRCPEDYAWQDAIEAAFDSYLVELEEAFDSYLVELEGMR
ncbi:hypothetical protein [Thiolapillus sp.]|uniref:hypothetical protein n=1 Tax=Thiolapillus sp. TaxID=2017437 RepID=UPI003AF5464E